MQSGIRRLRNQELLACEQLWHKEGFERTRKGKPSLCKVTGERVYYRRFGNASLIWAVIELGSIWRAKNGQSFKGHNVKAFGLTPAQKVFNGWILS